MFLKQLPDQILFDFNIMNAPIYYFIKLETEFVTLQIMQLFMNFLWVSRKVNRLTLKSMEPMLLTFHEEFPQLKTFYEDNGIKEHSLLVEELMDYTYLCSIPV